MVFRKSCVEFVLLSFEQFAFLHFALDDSCIRIVADARKSIYFIVFTIVTCECTSVLRLPVGRFC